MPGVSPPAVQAPTKPGPPADEEPLLDVKGLKKHFPVTKGLLRRVRGQVRAVDGISFSIRKGETLGLVGESGCGKTTAGRTILRLMEPTAGEIWFRSMSGEKLDVTSLDKRRMMRLRREMRMVFQDPFTSLDPRATVMEIVGEPLRIHGLASGKRLERRVEELLESVGLNAQHARRYPHEFSGGQRQRIGIARALASDPSLIIADEPVSALDVSVQAQVLNLLEDLQEEFDLTYLFIAHDLSVVRHISDRVAVMYLGKIVELGETEEVYENPRHPYTEALLSAVPVTDPDLRPKRILLSGDVPSPINSPPGCRFHPRCKYADRACSQEEPLLLDVDTGHSCACHLSRVLELRGLT